MKSIVVYDSNFGNTKLLAETIAKELGGTAFSVNDVIGNSLKDINLLIVGSPIHAWRPTAKIRFFLKSLPAHSLSTISAAAFDTRIKIFISGNAAGKISQLMADKGAKIIVAPQAFYVIDSEGPLLEGEVESARRWAEQIIQKML